MIARRILKKIRQVETRFSAAQKDAKEETNQGQHALESPIFKGEHTGKPLAAAESSNTTENTEGSNSTTENQPDAPPSAKANSISWTVGVGGIGLGFLIMFLVGRSSPVDNVVEYC